MVTIHGVKWNIDIMNYNIHVDFIVIWTINMNHVEAQTNVTYRSLVCYHDEEYYWNLNKVISPAI